VSNQVISGGGKLRMMGVFCIIVLKTGKPRETSGYQVQGRNSNRVSQDNGAGC
jgi:hypothetical protein